jgi:protein phosphatase
VPVEVTWGSVTHAGSVRARNEDSVLAGPVLFAVADGMGGHAAGDVASAIAIAEVARVAVGDPVTIVDAITRANQAVRARAIEVAELTGMGTTLTGVAFLDGAEPQAIVFNVGDSRVYRQRRGEPIEQITADHSLVADLVRAGALNADDARTSRQRHVVTRALGIEADVSCDTWLLDVASGDVFLVCSDGLSDELDEPALDEVLAAADEPQAAANLLLERALDHGARDNVSCVVVHVDEVSVMTGEIDEDTNPRVAAPAPAAESPAPIIDAVPGVPARSEPSNGEHPDGEMIRRVPSGDRGPAFAAP